MSRKVGGSMSVSTQMKLRTWGMVSGAVAAFAASALVACGGETPPPAPLPDQRPPPVMPVPPVVDAGATVALDAGPPPPQLATPTALATRQGTISAIVADANWVYWLTVDGDVKRVHAAGGPASAVASIGADSDDLLAVQGGTVTLATTEPKSKVTKILRANADLANKLEVIGTTTGTLTSLTADKSRVVWSSLDKKKLTFFVLENGQKSARRLPPVDAAIPGQHVILGTTNAIFFDTGSVKSIALANGKVSTLVQLTDAQLVTEIVVAGDRLFTAFWDVDKSDSTKKTTSVVSVPLTGGAPTTVLQGDVHNVFDMVADGDNVYWADNDATAKADTMSGRVMRLSLTSGTLTLIADHQMYPDAITLDGDNVYWANENSSAANLDSDLWKLAK